MAEIVTTKYTEEHKPDNILQYTEYTSIAPSLCIVALVMGRELGYYE